MDDEQERELMEGWARVRAKATELLEALSTYAERGELSEDLITHATALEHALEDVS